MPDPRVMTFADWVMLATGARGAILVALGLADAARRWRQ